MKQVVGREMEEALEKTGVLILDDLQVGLSQGRGRGLFASRPLAKGRVVSVSWSWEMTPADLAIFDATSLGGHWFEHPNKPSHGLLPLGPAALVNHASLPNCSLVWQESPLGYVGIMTATEDIPAGREVFIDYGIPLPEGWI